MHTKLWADLAKVPVWAVSDDAAALLLHAAMQAADSPSQRRAVAAMPIENGVALIHVDGFLTPRATLWSEFFGATACDSIEAQLRSALATDEVKAIQFVFDSPGGDVAGVPELADLIFEARAKKPILAHVRHTAASGAYWLASQAQTITAEPSSDVGSIGVFTIHQNVAKMLEDAGVEVTLIKAGRYKAEWAPYGPLSDEAREHAQQQVDATYAMFVRAVARGRGVDEATVRSTYGEGRSLMAKDAKAAGMIDRIATHADSMPAASGRRAMRAEAIDNDQARIDAEYLTLT